MSRRLNVHNSDSAVHCPDGGACPGGRAQPHPKRGYWGDHDYPTEFWECEQGACEGGEDFSCNAGYHGRVCNRMDDDRYRVAEIQLACPDGAAARWALICAGNNQWNAPSSKNFQTSLARSHRSRFD